MNAYFYETATFPNHTEFILTITTKLREQKNINGGGGEPYKTEKHEPNYDSRLTRMSSEVQLDAIPEKSTETIKTLYVNSKGIHIWEKAMHTCMTNNLIKEANYALPTEYHPS